jgi:predicted nucleic acid-binding protein
VKRTYLDSSVLIQAVQGADAGLTFNLLQDSNRQFVASSFLKLETLPQPTFHKRSAELEFLEAFFAQVIEWAEVSEDLMEKSLKESCEVPLSAIDGIHIAAAKVLKADEFITAERPGKPLHRVKGLKVIYLPNAR